MAVLVMFAAGTVNAQEWTKEQTDVWKVVQDSWKGWQNGDATAVFATVHEKYQGWSDDMPLPIGKQSMMDWYNSMKGSMKFNYFNIEPARILVTKSIAVVHYYYYFNVSWTMGGESKTEDVKGKVAEFYVNEGGKWQLIGDMMIHEDSEDDD
ncbi:MAG: nuclear transport factor 2 family protein [Bacteroidales bacterium]|nr:nuclear transport factor 2 family protein [Bacteroidales bacterium]